MKKQAEVLGTRIFYEVVQMQQVESQDPDVKIDGSHSEYADADNAAQNDERSRIVRTMMMMALTQPIGLEKIEREIEKAEKENICPTCGLIREDYMQSRWRR